MSAYWIHLISPVPAAIALPLTEGLTSEAVCRDNRIRDILPRKLLTCREAIRLALDRLRQQRVDTCWMDAGELIEPEWAHCGDADWAGGTIMNCGYRAQVLADAEDLWRSDPQDRRQNRVVLSGHALAVARHDGPDRRGRGSASRTTSSHRPDGGRRP